MRSKPSGSVVNECMQFKNEIIAAKDGHHNGRVNDGGVVDRIIISKSPWENERCLLSSSCEVAFAYVELVNFHKMGPVVQTLICLFYPLTTK
jgi:hypothetical protein